MTPKEKAQKLIAKFNNEHIEDTYVIYQNVDESKRCALIAVDNILFELTSVTYGIEYLSKRDYWQEVKTEIENL
jgi:hypothetical protein